MTRAEDLLVGRRPFEGSVRRDDVADERDARRAGHAEHRTVLGTQHEAPVPPKASTGARWPSEPCSGPDCGPEIAPQVPCCHVHVRGSLRYHLAESRADVHPKATACHHGLTHCGRRDHHSRVTYARPRGQGRVHAVNRPLRLVGDGGEVVQRRPRGAAHSGDDAPPAVQPFPRQWSSREGTRR